MSKRRGRGEGGIHWDKTRERWIVTVTIGFTPAGKRIVRKRSSKTKEGANNKLRELLDEVADGAAVAPSDYTVANAVHAWLARGLRGRDRGTVAKWTTLATVHILEIPYFAKKRLSRLTADDVDEWLEDRAKDLSTSTIQNLHSLLRRAIDFAIRRGKARRNVVLLCDAPHGAGSGRRSKSLDLEQAERVLAAAEAGDSTIGDYIIVSLLTGARTEELRALEWKLTDLDGKPDRQPVVLPSISVWRSVRAHGDTKTRKSRRTLALPQRAVAALQRQAARQQRQRTEAGEHWRDHGLVFSSELGTPLDAANVRRAARRIFKTAGLDAARWTPRELRHTFVSILSDADIPIEKISLLVGHASTKTTETIYRHQLRPALQDGARVFDVIFRSGSDDGQRGRSHSLSHSSPAESSATER